jgi:hypothetical protein
VVPDKQRTPPVGNFLVVTEGEVQGGVPQEQAYIGIIFLEVGSEGGDAALDLRAIWGEGAEVVVRGPDLANVGDQAGSTLDTGGAQGAVKELTGGTHEGDASDLLLLTGSLAYNGNS